MSSLSPVRHAKGARQPSLYGQILSDGLPVNLAGATVTFYMRPIGSSTPKVNGAAAVIDTPSTGSVHYAWAAADVDTAGNYLGWWRVTTAGQYEDTPEFLIIVTDHVLTTAYVSPEELKQSLSLKADYADEDVATAVAAATLAVNSRTGRSFALGAPGESRTFSTVSADWVEIDDLVALTSITVAGTALTVTQYQTVAPRVGWPIDVIEALPGYSFPTRTRSIVVTGQFGWPSVPEDVKAATKIIAARVLRRVREATFGVVGLGFEGAAVHIARYDPDLDLLLTDYERGGGSLAQ